MRELEAQLAQEKITYGRMVELIESKVLKDHISKSDLLVQIEHAVKKMKGLYNDESSDEATRRYAYNRFAALQWLKDWVPHIVNVANAESGNLGQSESTPNPMQALRGEPASMRCLKCKHEWKIELPALYKETFCPNCGE